MQRVAVRRARRSRRARSAALAGYGAQAILAQWLTGVLHRRRCRCPGPLPALQRRGDRLRAAARLHAAAAAAAAQRLDAARAAPRPRARRAAERARPSCSASRALAALIVWQAGDVKLGAIALGGFAAALVVAAHRRLRADPPGHAPARRGARGRGATGSRTCAGARARAWCRSWRSGLGIMAMLLLTLVRTDLLAKWQQSMPPDMPNRFAINIQTDQLAELQRYFGRAEARHARPLPDGPRAPDGDQRAHGHRPRTTRTSAPSAWSSASSTSRRRDKAAARQQDRRRAASGSPDRSEPQFSVEEGIAKTLGIKLGDTLTFEVAGSRFTAQGDEPAQGRLGLVQGQLLRDREPGAAARAIPASWITSFHLPRGQRGRGRRASCSASRT